jgi:nitroreductase
VTGAPCDDAGGKQIGGEMLSPFTDDHSLFRIIRAAQRAPSVHNTQPWSFWVRADDRIDLRANIRARDSDHPAGWLHFSDPLARELVISCGAALFNLRMAVRASGHDLAVWLLPDPDGDPALLASVEIVTGRILRPSADEQELYDAITRRHTYRWPFTTKHRVPASILTEMQFTAAKERGWLRALYPFQATDWLHAAGQAERSLVCDKEYLTEMRRWTTGAERGLGVPKSAYGPQPESRNSPVRDYNCTVRDGRPAERFETHPQLLSLATDDDRPLDWLRAGQALQRALLEATRHGVAASFLTQSLELADHRRQTRRWPAAWSFAETPQMIIRVGYPARPAPVTPREHTPLVVDLRGAAPRYVLPPGVPAAERELSARWHQRGRLPG